MPVWSSELYYPREEEEKAIPKSLPKTYIQKRMFKKESISAERGKNYHCSAGWKYWKCLKGTQLD